VVIVDDERLDVVTRGEYIEKQAEIIVVAVRGNQIIVKEKD
jgi:membrane-bound ClpP family serine protease